MLNRVFRSEKLELRIGIIPCLRISIKLECRKGDYALVNLVLGSFILANDQLRVYLPGDFA